MFSYWPPEKPPKIINLSIIGYQRATEAAGDGRETFMRYHLLSALIKSRIYMLERILFLSSIPPTEIRLSVLKTEIELLKAATGSGASWVH